MKYIYFFFIICFNLKQLKSSNNEIVCIVLNDSSYLKIESIKSENIQLSTISENSFKRPNPLLLMFRKKQAKNKKAVAAVLAFPFPFGMVGLHRIYLGTAPYVPIVYIGTVGGGFGILPFIDFCVILLDKDITRYHENKKIFMWVND